MEEFNIRKGHFLASDQKIKSHNIKTGQLFTLGHNFFSDHTKTELKKLTGPKKDFKTMETFWIPVDNNPTLEICEDKDTLGCAMSFGFSACWSDYAHKNCQKKCNLCKKKEYGVKPTPGLTAK